MLTTLGRHARLEQAWPKRTTLSLMFALWTISAGCSIETQIQHDPLLPTSADTITFTVETAESTGYGSISSQEIKIFVDGAHVQTCSASPCVYTGGPYPALTNDWLIYHTEVTADFDFSLLGFSSSDPESAYDLGATAVAQADRSWKAVDGVTHVPARWGAHTSTNTNVLFQRSDDYDTTSPAAGLDDFADDLSFKVNSLLIPKEKIWGRMNDLNLYAYRRAANTDTSECPGTLNSLTLAETGTVIDDHGVMHTANFQDCTTSFSIFSFEGATNTQAFLHEFAHAIFRQADEYAGNTFYFEADNEPNIFESESNCQSEQISKGRDPSACYEFKTGWWGTHTGTTVMTNGLFNHPWSLESKERQDFWFDAN